MAGAGKASRVGAVEVAGIFLVMMAVAGGAQAKSSSVLAEGCRSIHTWGTPWTPVSPSISSSAEVGEVLAYRSAVLTTAYKLGELDPKPQDKSNYELVVAAMWQSNAGVTPQGLVTTNVPGIAMVISVDDLVLKPTSMPVVLAKYPLLHGTQQVDTPMTKQLVLSVPPEQLPLNSGPMSVTGFGLGPALTLYVINFPKDAYMVGQTITGLPSYPEHIRACIGPNEPPYTGSKIMELGAGGSSVLFSNACEVGMTQTKEVLMGTHSVRDFPHQDSVSRPKPLDITLSQCSVLAKPKITFTAKHGASQDKTVLNLDPNADADGQSMAQGFGIIMVNDATNRRIEFGKPYDMTRIDADGAQIRLRASYLRTASNPAQMAGGHANGTAEFTIDFP